ncbi:AAA family ATPase [Streptomyces sp. NRRL B-3229]|uniref:AAA family ATPase n=1 Tax=Streptomyces sp. NRRL B-3229 TaxID=1463836 RepID=UPI0005623564|nr:ATP-binding protein [Streptomyces sp. NRRL B-3229]
MTAYQDTFEHLADELRRLDLLIALRLRTADLLDEAFPHSQLDRTVYISRQEVDRLLTDGFDADADSGTAADALALKLLSTEIDTRLQDSARAGTEPPLSVLGRLFGLSPLERAAVVVCLAPELRRKYDRLYAYLQDDITRRRPSVDLVLELLCTSERERWIRVGAFAAGAPLLRYGILRAVDDPHSPSGSSDLARFLVLDPRIRAYLLGSAEPDGRLLGHVVVHRPAGPGGPEPDPALADLLLRTAAHHLRPGRPPLVLHLYGPDGDGQFDLVRHTGRQLGLTVVGADAATLTGPGGTARLQLVFREALLQGAAVHLAHADTLLREEHRELLGALAEEVLDYGLPLFLTGVSHWTAGPTPLPVHSLEVPLPDGAHSIALWRELLAPYTERAEEWAGDLAVRHRLPASRIAAAVRGADHVRLTRGGSAPLTLADVSAACRREAQHSLGPAAGRVRARRGWDDLVLPADRLTQLGDICDQVRFRQRVLHDWGFGARLGHGTGLSVLFSGPPGTGKTMAAEVLAHELDVDLYKIDLSGVVSKYIGETEKNLARIFAEASTGNAILFFDEADALFGKRTEVTDAHDRYANIETSYLLQRIEEYEGVVVLATNLRQNIDDAFTRRIRFVVAFPFPDADERRRIWRTLLPPGAPLAPDVDLAVLARELPVTGANIRNIVLQAAFLAAADGTAIGRAHILRGARREFEKIGKLWAETG